MKNIQEITVTEILKFPIGMPQHYFGETDEFWKTFSNNLNAEGEFKSEILPQILPHFRVMRIVVRKPKPKTWKQFL